MGFYPFGTGGAQGIAPPLGLSGPASAPMFTTQETGDAQPRVVLETQGIWLGNGVLVPAGPMIQNGGAGVTQFNGKISGAAGVDVIAAGFGLSVAEGSNAKQGVATLVAGTVTVANTSVTANSRIMLTTQTPGGTAGFLVVSARVAGTSFTILSSNAADTSVVAYEIFEPG
jgi:hypothetical protein